MNNSTQNRDINEKTRHFGFLKLFFTIVAAASLAAVIAFWAVTYYLFPKELKPVKLNAGEEKVLSEKVERLHSIQEKKLEPEAYSEEGATREIVLSERELNALVAKNTDLAKKLAIDLSDDLASVKLLLHLDEDFPFLGGKTLRARAGLKVGFKSGRPIVALKGISIWGVPLPNAWMGNMKNVDLVKEYGAREGFWKAFGDGIDHIKIEEGSLIVRLKK